VASKKFVSLHPSTNRPDKVGQGQEEREKEGKRKKKREKRKEKGGR